MTAARLFRNGHSQAVRIPKSMEFVGIDEVQIERIADTIILRPLRKDWLSFADEMDALDATGDPAANRAVLDDFMKERPELLTLREVKLEPDAP